MAGQPRGAGGCDEPCATPCPKEGRLLLALTGSSHTVPQVKPRREDEGQHNRNTRSLLAVSFPLQAPFLPAAAFSSRCAVPIALSARPQHPEPGRGQAAPGTAEGNRGSTGQAEDAAAPLPLLGIPSSHISSTDSPNQAFGALFKA